MPPDTDAEEVAWVFHPDRGKWANVNVHDRATVDLLAENGLDYFNYRQWFSYGFTVDECLSWELRMFVPSVAAAWVAEGCTAAEAHDWVMFIGNTTADGPAQSAAWRTLFSVEEATKWRNQGLDPAAAAIRSRKFAGNGI